MRRLAAGLAPVARLLRRPPTLRGRLALIAAAVAAVWVLVMTVGIDLVLVHQLDAQAADVLRARNEAAAATVSVDATGRVVVREPRNDEVLDTQIWVYQGNRVVEEPLRRRALRPAVESVVGRGERLADVEDTRLFARPVLSRGRQVGTIVSAVDLQPYANSAHLVVGGSVVLAILLLGSVYPITRIVIARALRPVADMSEQAARWSADDVRQRFGAGDRPQELARLSADLDGLLDRLAAVLRHERRLSAEISHELRTPLARIVAEVELLQREQRVPAAEVRSGLANVAGSAAQMEQILETLLATARSDSSSPPGRCLLAPVVRRAVELAALPAGLCVEVRDAPAPSTAGVDAAVAERILGPVLQNAGRHARTRITVESRLVPEAIEVVVADDGPGLGELGVAAFEPGVRGDPRHDGAGLGLALARRLARSAGGDITLVPSEVGAAFRIALPRG